MQTHLFVLAAAFAAQAATATMPPDLTLPPETARLVIILEGRGTQNYLCTAHPARKSDTYSWDFQAPEADLYNLATGQLLGHHQAGPTWTLQDGSALHGILLQKKAGDTPADVPWLLLKAEPVPGSPGGTLSPATLIRRSETHGGAAPSGGCDAAHAGSSVKVPYSATYAFYTNAPASR